MAFSGYEVKSVLNFEPLIDGEFYCVFPNDRGVNLLDIGNGLKVFPAKNIKLSLGEPVIETIELQQGLSYQIPTKITNVKTLSMEGLESHKNELLSFMMKWVLDKNLEKMRVPDMSKYAKSVQVHQFSNGSPIFQGDYTIIPDTSMGIELSMSHEANIVTKPMSFYIIKTIKQEVDNKSFLPFSS